jgi:hypothetical protein
MEEPDWMFDPNNRPTAPCPPGLDWFFGGNPMKWFQSSTDGRTPVAPVVAPVASVVERPSFLESAAGIALISGTLTALATIGAKLVEPKPAPPPPADPMVALAALMAALNGNKGDPKELKQLEIDAESRRASAALDAENARIERENARAETLRIAADAQRAHDLKVESDRREAMRLEAIAADERARIRAKEDSDRLVMMSKLGLDPNAKPQKSEEAIRAEVEAKMLSDQLKAELIAARSAGDIDAQIRKATSVLKAAGIDVEGAGATSAMMEFFNTQGGKEVAGQGIMLADKLLSRLMGSPAGPSQADIDAVVQQRVQLELHRMHQAQLAQQPVTVQHAPQMAYVAPVVQMPAQTSYVAPVVPREQSPVEQPDTFGPESQVAFGPTEPVPQPIAEAPPAPPPVDDDAALREAALRARTVSPAVEAPVEDANAARDARKAAQEAEAAEVAAALAARTKAPEESPEAKAAREEAEFAEMLDAEERAKATAALPADA